jgi:hypothetical protein
MTPAEELRAAATLLRDAQPYGRIDVLLAAVLDNAADVYDFGMEGCSPDLRSLVEPRVRATVAPELELARVTNEAMERPNDHQPKNRENGDT